MTGDCSNKLNPLRIDRSGVHQDGRAFHAMASDYVDIDEREAADDIVLAARFAELVYFADVQSPYPGTWERFFKANGVAALALAATQDARQFQQFTRYGLLTLQNVHLRHQEDLLSKSFGNLFNIVGTLVWQMERMRQHLSPNAPIKSSLENLITTQLVPAFHQLIGYYQFARKQIDPITLRCDIDLSAPVDFEIMSETVIRFDVVLQKSFSDAWSPPGLAWHDFIAQKTSDIAPGDGLIYGHPLPPTMFERLQHATGHALFKAIFNLFLKAYSKLIEEATQHLAHVFLNQSDHAPHYTLFLSFVRLFQEARQNLNKLKDQHLRYYYEEILKLQLRSSLPNYAHLTIELAKHADTQLIPKGTLFKGGKDQAGKDVFFESMQDFVANKAKAQSLCSLFRYDRRSGDRMPALDDGRFYASPVSNSTDGRGAPLLSPDLQWHPFANKHFERGVIDAIRMPLAEMGFAIASHYLFMQEGKRIVTLEINSPFPKIEKNTKPDAKGNQPNKRLEDLGDIFKIKFSGEKTWIDSKLLACWKLGQKVYIQCKVEGDQPAIVPCTQKVHGAMIPPGLPVMKVILKQSAQAKYGYAILEHIDVQDIRLTVKVSGIRNLQLANDIGVVASTKPFQPFGPVPRRGARFIVGYDEMFQKHLTSEENQLTIKWQSTNSNTLVDVLHLKNGNWEVFKGLRASPSIALMERSTTQVRFQIDETIPYRFEPAASYGPASVNGFLSFQLQDDLGQSTYQTKLLDYIAAKVADPSANISVPVLPLVPLIESITLTYEATCILLPGENKQAFQNRSTRFYHLTPFGYAEQHRQILSANLISLLPKFKTGLLHQDENCGASASFSIHAPALISQVKSSDLTTKVISETKPRNEDTQHEAEFYIGIADLHLPQNLALLFQIADGSADPRINKPDHHIHWSFLSNNEWFAFKKEEVNDQTGHLLHSGIITFSVPRKATNQNTLMPAGQHWLRAAIPRIRNEDGSLVATTSEAICKLLAVAAQAIMVRFKDHQNEANFSEAHVPPGTITKLKEPLAAIKKIEQPFASFGGRGKETQSHFSTRTAERLRHKHRAIMAWDYERLVLENFPKIYKVKCLNHTSFTPTPTGFGHYNELAPGHTTIVAIPNIRQQQHSNPLRPYVSLGELEAIEDFLKKYISCHVKLHVINPVFEPIRVSMCVKFRIGVDESFHVARLKQEIVKFLTPWAFDPDHALHFGGKAYKSTLINFIEERDYVDYLTDFKLFHQIIDINGVNRGQRDMEEIEASTAISILVSADAVEHAIQIIPSTVSDFAGEHCNC